ncbi:probable salivary secreted peptide [Belonocnema kinseyi]|uniref:probable salivary secreted peptide n=1 Tax=Belonocnema kinseyi TaxID=2817044 RepID=UPI00143D9C90|nr:probable salivary secreted peptide [Belonocnema kinseyi]
MALQKMPLILTFAIAMLLSMTVLSIADNECDEDKCDSDKSHHFCIGERVEGDRLVLKKAVYKQQEGICYHQERFSVPNKREMKITKVVAEDQMTDGTGAYCELIKGGVNEPNVTLEFSNMINGKIDFVVKLYA